MRLTKVYKQVGEDKKGRPILCHDPLLCCWDDCDKPGYEEYKLVIPHDQIPGATLTYVFCGERHQSMWGSSHVHNGDMPRSPLGLYLP